MAVRRFATAENLTAIAQAAEAAYEPKDQTIVHDSAYVHTDENFTETHKEKLESIRAYYTYEEVDGVMMLTLVESED